MDLMRIGQGCVFLGASALVIVVGMRGIDPGSIRLWVVYTALFFEAAMLVFIAMLYIFGTDNNRDHGSDKLRSTIDEVDDVLKEVVTRLNSPGVVGGLPAGVLDELSDIKGKVGYVRGILNVQGRS